MKKLLSHISIIAANLIWGLYATICKDFLYSGHVGSWALCGIKMMGGAVLLWGLSALLPASVAPREHVRTRDLPKLFLASMLINAGNQSCIIFGLKYTSPVSATVICSMAPIFTVVLAMLLYRQPLRPVKAIGVCIGFVGALLLAVPDILTAGGTANTLMVGDKPLLGNALVIASQIFGALYLLLFTDLFTKYSAVTLVKWLFMLSALVLAPITAYDIIQTNWTTLSTSHWIQLGYIVVFATGIAYLLLIIGQKKVTATSIAMYNYVQPVTATISSVAIGIVTITTQDLLAVLLCLAGVYIVIRR